LKKKLFCVFLTLCLVLGLLPVTALAEEGESSSGYDYIYWEFEKGNLVKKEGNVDNTTEVTSSSDKTSWYNGWYMLKGKGGYNSGGGIVHIYGGTVTVMGSDGGAGIGGGNGSYTLPSPVSEIKSGESVYKSNLDQLVFSGKNLTVTGDNCAKLVFDTEALKCIAGQTSDPIKVEIEDVSAEYQNSHPDKKVFYLTVSSCNKTITNFNGKVTVILPYELNEGENEENVTVWYLTNSGILIELPCKYDPETKLITFEVTHFSLYMIGIDTWTNPFVDVNENDLFYENVKFAKQNNLFVGTSNTNFSPESPMTREMLWTVIGRVDGGEKLYGDGVFEAAREWAMSAGITDGTNPKSNITREQIVTILWRYAGKPEANGDLSEFSDAESVSDYACDAMVWAVENGIIHGNDNGMLMPQDNATRAEFAAIMQRFIEATVK